MLWIIFSILTFFAILLEGTITIIPLVLAVLLVTAVMLKSRGVFILGFLAGILLDALSFHIIGMSSVYFLLVLLFVFLYDEKFEIRSAAFVFFMSLVGSMIYLWIFNYHENFQASLVSAVIAVGLFLICSLLAKISVKKK